MRLFLFGILLASLVWSKEFVVGVQDFPEYLPESQYQNGEYTGFARELLDMFAKDKGYTFTYEALPIKRLNNMFMADKVDLKYPDNSYWSKDQKEGKNIVYSDPVVKYIDGVVVLNKNKGKGMESLKKLGMVAGFTPFPYMDKIKAGAVEVHENNNYLGLLRMIFKDRVDGAYSNIAVSNYYLINSKIEEADKSALVFDESLPHIKSTRHLSTIRHPDVIKEFNEWMSANKAKVDALKQKHEVEKF